MEHVYVLTEESEVQEIHHIKNKSSFFLLQVIPPLDACLYWQKEILLEFFDIESPISVGLPIKNIEFMIWILLMGSPYIVGTCVLTFKVH